MGSRFNNFDAFTEAVTKELKRHDQAETVDVAITWGPANLYKPRTTWNVYFYNPEPAMQHRITQLEEELAKEKAKLAEHQAKENKK